MAKQAAADVKRRAYVSDFRMAFNAMETTGNLYLATKPQSQTAKGAVKTQMACPAHAEAGAAVHMRQAYLCTIDDSKDHGEWTSSECARGVDKEGTFTLVDGEAAQAAKEASDLPDKQVEFAVHAADEINPSLAQSGKMYLFEPKGEPGVFMTVLLGLMDEDGTVTTPNGKVRLVGQTLIRKEERMVVLGKWNGRLTINEVERPEDLIALDPVHFPDAGEKMLDTVRTLMGVSIETFDPGAYANQQRARIIEAMASDPEAGATKRKKQVERSTDDLIALLEASIAAKTA